VLIADEREQLTALDMATGAVVWRRELGLVAQLAADAAGDLAVTMLGSGEVTALELDDGAERWSIGHQGLAHGLVVTAKTAVIVTNEAIVVLWSDGHLRRWEVR